MSAAYRLAWAAIAVAGLWMAYLLVTHAGPPFHDGGQTPGWWR
jgi:hypothetical protein